MKAKELQIEGRKNIMKPQKYSAMRRPLSKVTPLVKTKNRVVFGVDPPALVLSLSLSLS